MEGEDEESEDDRSFQKKPALIRAIILAAGSLMNIALAILILSGIILYMGTSLTTNINTVTEGGPAQTAGILPGDKITAIDGVEIIIWDDVVNEISGTEKSMLSIEVARAGEKLAFETNITTANDGRKIIGITPDVKRNPLVALGRGTKASYEMMTNMVSHLGELFKGKIPTTELTGVVGIGFIVDDAVKQGGVQTLLYLIALISLNLAFVNLLPFPALDGGRLLFLIIRKITGKAISDRMEANIHLIGMVLLLALMVYVTWNDIERFVLKTLG